MKYTALLLLAFAVAVALAADYSGAPIPECQRECGDSIEHEAEAKKKLKDFFLIRGDANRTRRETCMVMLHNKEEYAATLKPPMGFNLFESFESNPAGRYDCMDDKCCECARDRMSGEMASTIHAHQNAAANGNAAITEVRALVESAVEPIMAAELVIPKKDRFAVNFHVIRDNLKGRLEDACIEVATSPISREAGFSKSNCDYSPGTYNKVFWDGVHDFVAKIRQEQDVQAMDIVNRINFAELYASDVTRALFSSKYIRGAATVPKMGRDAVEEEYSKRHFGEGSELLDTAAQTWCEENTPDGLPVSPKICCGAWAGFDLHRLND